MSALDDSDLRVTGQTVSLRDLVTEKLRLAIITGRFQPGQQLKERELCELTGVSRPSLREALRLLEAEGLVTSVLNRGQLVVKLTPEQVGQIYQMRQLLETFAAKEFARRRVPEELRALDQGIALLDDLRDNADRFAMLQAGRKIYSAIANGGGNAFVAETLGLLHNRIALIRFIALQDHDKFLTHCDELRALSKAIHDGDADLAKKLCKAHLAGIATTAEHIVANDYKL
ncbi:GntR family transcriptional regulator [Salipiger abyssi]|uniref:GntR family transcriptional regulator n=1 Tax=Salipiger abyssi TaxID=1250539 RepID=UPI001A8E5853|nr:GntR family transcriptional regulator [Salipiger abyssi]MBN9887218.1 GntR family transcriptional regulator [Salipiger abyssi]